MAARRKSTRKGQVFSIQAPAALTVQLAGDFTHWEKQPIAMIRGDKGVWSAAVDLPPGTYHYRFIIDGEWRDDPECTARVTNPYGGENSVRQVI